MLGRASSAGSGVLPWMAPHNMAQALSSHWPPAEACQGGAGARGRGGWPRSPRGEMDKITPTDGPRMKANSFPAVAP
eukprot:5029146-Pyramimonas_sp.AAC.1